MSQRRKYREAVILGEFINALGIVRSLGENGIKSVVFSPRRNIVFASRYAVGQLCPDPNENEDAFITHLQEYGKRLVSRGIIYVTSDDYLLAISRNASALAPYFHMDAYDNEVIGACVNKVRMYEVAQSLDIPCPHTRVYDSVDDLHLSCTEVLYPCIVKPQNPASLPLGTPGFARRKICSDAHELAHYKRRMQERGLARIPLILQEVIPGDAQNLYTVSTYSDKAGEIRAYSIGHKVRQYPPEAGTITIGVVTGKIDSILDYTQQIVRKIGFHGIANTEFKLDARDNTYRLMEINARPGKWNYSATASGANLSLVAYRDIMHNEPLPGAASTQSLHWGVWLEDFIYFVLICRKNGYRSFALSPRQWFKSLKRPYVDGLFQWRDCLPFFFYIGYCLKIGIRRIFRRR